mmetsp:Transcript_25265/g.83208  ORF Transcript_25265/g.83208 Transcript_25265/m.83208 type:complete len:240 (+) Transcript_25265:520-1239(+)
MGHTFSATSDTVPAASPILNATASDLSRVVEGLEEAAPEVRPACGASSGSTKSGRSSESDTCSSSHTAFTARVTVPCLLSSASHEERTSCGSIPCSVATFASVTADSYENERLMSYVPKASEDGEDGERALRRRRADVKNECGPSRGPGLSSSTGSRRRGRRKPGWKPCGNGSRGAMGVSCSASSKTSLCLTSPGGAWVKQGSAMTGCRGPGCGGGEAATLVSLVVFAASRAFSLASAS